MIHRSNNGQKHLWLDERDDQIRILELNGDVLDSITKPVTRGWWMPLCSCDGATDGRVIIGRVCARCHSSSDAEFLDGRRVGVG